jgi:hypothetical protein
MKTRKELIEILKEKANKIEIDYTNNNIYVNKPWNDKTQDLLTECDEQEFRLVHSVSNSSNYYYYISNIGRVIVVNTNRANPCIKNNELNKYKYWFISIKNGYLSTSDLDKNFPNIKIATYTDVYSFMIEAGWLEDSEDEENDKSLSLQIVNYNKEKEYLNDRIEVHHIDNNPSNNNVKNLIWLPKSIHQKLHKL